MTKKLYTNITGLAVVSFAIAFIATSAFLNPIAYQVEAAKSAPVIPQADPRIGFLMEWDILNANGYTFYGTGTIAVYAIHPDKTMCYWLDSVYTPGEKVGGTCKVSPQERSLKGVDEFKTHFINNWR